MLSKLVTKPIFFASEELERERMRYYDLLNGVLGENPDWGSWILFFLTACNRMAETLAENGLKLCETPSDRKVWLYTFSNPFVFAKTPPIVYFTLLEVFLYCLNYLSSFTRTFVICGYIYY